MVEIILPAQVLHPGIPIFGIEEAVVATTGVVTVDIFQAHLDTLFAGQRIHIINLSGMLFSTGIVDAPHPVTVGIEIVFHLTVFCFVFAVARIPLEAV